jgi:hypothetical protein
MTPQNETDIVPDLYRLAFMPGCFRCPKCGFVLSKTCINPNLEIIGTREQDRESEPCPNDGTMLVHVTYKEQLEVYADRLKEEFDRIDNLNAELAEVKQALQNTRERCNIELEAKRAAERDRLSIRDSCAQIAADFAAEYDHDGVDNCGRYDNEAYICRKIEKAIRAIK